jgi:hydrogenase maturation protease
MGGQVKRLLVVGCEPEPLADADDMRMELSEPVRSAVDEAVTLVESLVAEILTRPLAA